MNDPILAALKSALDKDPRNAPLWLHYAELLEGAGAHDEAIAALRTTLELEGDARSALRRLVPLLRQRDQLSEALIRAEKFLATDNDPIVRVELARVLHQRGDRDGARTHYRQAIADDASLADPNLEAAFHDGGASPTTEAVKPAAEPEAEPETRPQEDVPDYEVKDTSPTDEPAAGGESDDGDDTSDDDRLAEVAPEAGEVEEWAKQFDWGDLHVTFADVAGLKDVKKQINLRIIAPFKNKEIYQAFRRQGGGGILMYGPPGCGKTYVAKATAGECGARFVSIGLHDILDRYWGESEKLIHGLFEEARRRAPTVLFFDEFDAIGTTRTRSESHFIKTVVDQLLQEMDGVGGKNDDVLVFAATNVPWNVDSAFRRPGRFDRLLFVPPPDEEARLQIIQMHAEKLPAAEKLPLTALAKKTSLFTGADLKSLVERASERALERSLETGEIHPVVAKDFDRELKKMSSSAEEWLSTAKNYARYSNEGGRYDELADFLKRAKRW